ncbi:MAG: hypothetical protein ACYDAD_14315 [Acidimicrobiales bacterium]
MTASTTGVAEQSATAPQQGEPMTVTMTCKHCGAVMTADTEDELVTEVQAHVSGHDEKATLSKEHILRRLHRLQRNDSREL